MRFLVLGAGYQGFAAALDLARAPDVEEVVVADVDAARARRVADRLQGSRAPVRAEKLDVTNEPHLAEKLRGYDVVVSAVPYFLNLSLTRAAIDAGVSFCDLGGNTDLVREQEALDERARDADVMIVPDCGLAPGMANVLAAAGIARLDRADEVRIRVGGLPLRPRPPLDYQIAFSMHGLLNEYLGFATALRGGKRVSLETLSEEETLSFPKPVGTCEAFVTLGGSSTMPWTFEGKVKTLDYKTVRYPGHAKRIRLLRDLGLLETTPVPVDGIPVSPRSLFAAVVEPLLTFPNEPDVVVMRVVVTGMKEGTRREISFEMLDRMDTKRGVSAMMRTTAYPTAAAALMMARGDVPFRGVAAMERAIPAEPFLKEIGKHDLKVMVRERTLTSPRGRASGAGGRARPLARRTRPAPSRGRSATKRRSG